MKSFFQYITEQEQKYLPRSRAFVGGHRANQGDLMVRKAYTPEDEPKLDALTHPRRRPEGGGPIPAGPQLTPPPSTFRPPASSESQSSRMTLPTPEEIGRAEEADAYMRQRKPDRPGETVSDEEENRRIKSWRERRERKNRDGPVGVRSDNDLMREKLKGKDKPLKRSDLIKRTPDQIKHDEEIRRVRAERNKANDPFELYPDYGDAEPSVHRARDARDRGLKNLEKRQARNIPRETLGDNTPSRIKSTKSRIESGKMIPALWTVVGRDNKGRPWDEYGFTDQK